MIKANINLSRNVYVDSSSSINNVTIDEGVKRCSLFGSEKFVLEIGKDTYVGMNTIINGFLAKVIIGSNVSIAQSVNIMTSSGPNASEEMQKFFPLESGPVEIGLVQIVLNVKLGEFVLLQQIVLILL